jgi:hypothetical protein
MKFILGFIIKRGKIHKPIKDLIHDMREVMYPYTALKLHVCKYLIIVGRRKYKNQRLHKSLWILENDSHANFYLDRKKLIKINIQGNYFKILKTPDGPTLTFKMMNYSTR